MLTIPTYCIPLTPTTSCPHKHHADSLLAMFAKPKKKKKKKKDKVKQSVHT